MNACLWCDAPTEKRLCSDCRAVNDHSLFYCHVNVKHIPTLGDSCAECGWIAAAKARRAANVAERLQSLRIIRAKHVEEWSKPWPGLEFGKAMVGMMIDGAIEQLETT